MGVTMYVLPNPRGEWSPIGLPLTPDDRPGSISSEPPEGQGQREVYVFGYFDGYPGLWRAKAGADLAMEDLRALVTEGLEPMSDLSDPYEMELWHRHLGLVRVRFVLGEK